ncbi:hypothetical protein GGG16DRAFT_106788 [Schizophyllum commune]
MPGMAHQWLFAHVSAGLCKWLVGNSNETATASEFAYPADFVPNRHRKLKKKNPCEQSMSSTPLEVLGLIFDEMAAGEDKFEVAAMLHFLRWKDRWASVEFERRCIIPQQYPFARGGLYYMMGHDPCPNMTRLCVRIIGADIARYSNVFDNSAPRGLAQLVPQPTRLTSLEISLSVGARNLKLDVPMTYSLPPRTITLARLRTLHICGDSGRLLQWTVLPGVEEIRLERITNSHSSDLWNCFWDGLRKGTIGAGSIQAMALINAMWDYGPEMRSSIDVTKNVKQLTMVCDGDGQEGDLCWRAALRVLQELATSLEMWPLLERVSLIGGWRAASPAAQSRLLGLLHAKGRARLRHLTTDVSIDGAGVDVYERIGTEGWHGLD